MYSTSDLVTMKRRKSSIGCLWKFSEQFLIHVICPDNSSLTLIHSIKESCCNVLTSACARLGIAETEIFGLALYRYNEYHFLGGSKCLNNIFPKWATVTGESLSGSDKCHAVADTLIKTCKMYLRIKHIVSSLDILSPNTIRFLYEQLRWDLIKMHNLFGFEDYNDECVKLAFYTMLVDPCDGKLLSQDGIISYYLPQKVIKANTMDSIISDICRISRDLPLMTLFEAQISFIKLALKLPVVGTHIFYGDIADSNIVPVTNCLISVGPNGIRIFFDENGDIRQFVKWDVQEIDEISFSKNVVTILGDDDDNEETNLQLYNKSKAKRFTKFCKEIQRFDETTFVDAVLVSANWNRKIENSFCNSSNVIVKTPKRKISMVDRKSSRLQYPLNDKRLSERRPSDQFCGMRRDSHFS